VGRYGNCIECKNPLKKGEGFNVCIKCGEVLCDKCAAISTLCTKCSKKHYGE